MNILKSGNQKSQMSRYFENMLALYTSNLISLISLESTEKI